MSLDGFSVFRSVVFALFLRKIKTGFEKNRLGYIWTIIEPMIQIIILFGLNSGKKLTFLAMLLSPNLFIITEEYKY